VRLKGEVRLIFARAPTINKYGTIATTGVEVRLLPGSDCCIATS